MQKVREEITKEQFEKLQAMSYAEQHDELFPNGVPESWAMGYGYYGHLLIEKDGKYYAVYKIGSSCD